MRVLIAASEAVPFCKTGGLADVIGALSQKLGVAGHDVVLFLPKYRAVESAALQGGMAYPLDIPWGSGAVQVSLRYMQWRSVMVQFIDCPPLFDRDGLYWNHGVDHADNDLRFGVFSRAVLEGAKALGFKPDVVHLHDWQTALAAAYLKTVYRKDAFFARTASVLTVHNIAYPGAFPAESFLRGGFLRRQFQAARFSGGRRAAPLFSFLRLGLVHADRIVTVSPSYAAEIQTPAGGLGMEDVLRRRRARLAGILNGLDLETWNPGRDGFLAARFSAEAPAGKEACRKDLLARCGLKAPAGVPVVGMVARLDRQKGWDLAMKVLEARLDRCRFVGVGEGDPALVAAVAKWAARRAGRAFYRHGYDEEFAHRLYAGADILLMPSRFEPCGLGQMIAMRYGCVPVASRTGGLADTVRESGEEANGFLAAPGRVREIGRALDRALDCFGSAAWRQRVERGMRSDFAWDRSVRRYIELYGQAAGRAAGGA